MGREVELVKTMLYVRRGVVAAMGFAVTSENPIEHLDCIDRITVDATTVP